MIRKFCAARIELGHLRDCEARDALPVASRRTGGEHHPVFDGSVCHRLGLQQQQRPHGL